MKVIQPYFIIEDQIDANDILRKLERAGRTCYKSENKITETSLYNFLKRIINSGHLTVIEHHSITVRVICDRGVSHEIVRHRLASYSQESTRYCNYSKGKFGNELTFIEPPFLKKGSEEYKLWFNTLYKIEDNYIKLINMGAPPQEARTILPNSLKTEIVITMNLREWRHFFNLRTSKSAHPQIREIAIPILEEFRKKIPIIFDDIKVD